MHRTAHLQLVVIIGLTTACSESDDSDDSFGGEGTTSGETSGSSSSESGEAGEVSSSGPIFDVGSAETGGEGCRSCGNSDWSYIWVANSNESTVSKIDTRTLTEEGRYLTRMDGAGSPSRTSVSIDGRAVVVANRATGLIKIWASTDDCVDSNGMPGIQTSMGSTNVLGWDQDECVAWFMPFDDMTVQRPVAWTAGEINEDTCVHENQKIWTVTADMGPNQGSCGPGSGTYVHLIDGDGGTVDDTIHIPNSDTPCTQGGGMVGAYGGAVDSEGNFWFHGRENQYLVRVAREDLSYEVFPDAGSYGITVDTDGRVWTTRYDHVGMFDYETASWQTIDIGFLPGESGMAEDHQKRIWTGGKSLNSPAVVGWIDMETLTVGDAFDLDTANYPKGVSADIDGFVWASGGMTATKIEPDTYVQTSYFGLNGAYTYSDMTGGALDNVTCNDPAG